jgi:hypothetical protein
MTGRPVESNHDVTFSLPAVLHTVAYSIVAKPGNVANRPVLKVLDIGRIDLYIRIAIRSDSCKYPKIALT